MSENNSWRIGKKALALAFGTAMFFISVPEEADASCFLCCNPCVVSRPDEGVGIGLVGGAILAFQTFVQKTVEDFKSLRAAGKSLAKSIDSKIRVAATDSDSVNHHILERQAAMGKVQLAMLPAQSKVPAQTAMGFQASTLTEHYSDNLSVAYERDIVGYMTNPQGPVNSISRQFNSIKPYLTAGQVPGNSPTDPEGNELVTRLLNQQTIDDTTSQSVATMVQGLTLPAVIDNQIVGKQFDTPAGQEYEVGQRQKIAMLDVAAQPMIRELADRSPPPASLSSHISSGCSTYLSWGRDIASEIGPVPASATLSSYQMRKLANSDYAKAPSWSRGLIQEPGEATVMNIAVMGKAARLRQLFQMRDSLEMSNIQLSQQLRLQLQHRYSELGFASAPVQQ